MKIHVTSPLFVNIYVFDGFLESSDKIHELKEAPITRISLNRWMISPDVERIEMNFEKDGTHGTMFIPPGEGPFPGKWDHRPWCSFCLTNLVEI